MFLCEGETIGFQNPEGYFCEKKKLVFSSKARIEALEMGILRFVNKICKN